MEITSLIIAILALLFSVFTFFFYERKLNKQNEKINEYQLKNYKAEEDSVRHAQICANPFYHKDFTTKVKIYNKGKGVAKNINFDFEEDSKVPDLQVCVLNLDTLLPFPLLNPQEGFEVVLRVYHENISVLMMKIEWDDEAGHQTFTQALQLK